VDDADVATTNGVGRRQRCAARQTAAAVGAATGGGDGRAGVATEGGRDYRGRRLATGVWRAGGGRGRACGAGARRRHGGGRRPAGALLPAAGGQLSSDGGRAARWAWRHVGGSGGGCSVERKREERIADWPGGYFEFPSARVLTDGHYLIVVGLLLADGDYVIPAGPCAGRWECYRFL
jgi:hypothetical protein